MRSFETKIRPDKEKGTNFAKFRVADDSSCSTQMES